MLSSLFCEMGRNEKEEEKVCGLKKGSGKAKAVYARKEKAFTTDVQALPGKQTSTCVIKHCLGRHVPSKLQVFLVLKLKENHTQLYSTEKLFIFICLVEIISTKETHGSKIASPANQPTQKTGFSIDL